MDTYKKPIIWIAKVPLLLSPLIPLFIEKHLFFPYITGKAFVFRTLIAIAFFAWLYLAIRCKEFRPRFSPLLWAVFAFVFIAALAAVFGVNPFRSFWSNFERMEGLVTYLYLAAYFTVLASLFRKQDWTVFFNMVLVSGVIQVGYALLQHSGKIPSPQGGFRVDGTIGNPTYLAAYLIFVLSIAIFLAMKSRRVELRLIYGAAAAMVGVVIFFTATRGAILGILGGLMMAAVLFLILSPRGDRAYRKKRLMTAGIVFIIIAASLGAWAARNTPFVRESQILSRLTSLSFTERTITSRFTIWRMSFEAFQERPLLGWGPENYPVVFSKYFKAELWRQEPWFDRSHNIVFDWLINAGILGLAAYVAMFGAALNLLWRKKMPTPIKQPFSLEERILFSSMLAAYVAQNLFVFDQIATYLMFFAILAYIGSRTAAQDAAENRMRGGDGFKTVFIGGLCAVAMGVVLYMAVWRPLFVNRSLLAALSLQAANADATRTLERFERILPYQTVGRTEVREQLIRFAIGAVGAQTVPNEQKQRIAELAIAEGKTNSAENPGDARPVVILGNFYATIGLIEDAKSTLTKAIALSPKKQDLYFELADAYLRVNEIEEALTVLQKAFDLDPAHDRARNNLAAVFIMSGKQAEADDLLREWYGTVDVAEILFARVYGQLQNYDRLAGVWRAFVKSDPFAVEYRINLAEAYVKLNNRAEAIRTLEEAIVEIPEFRDQGNEMIQQIKTTKLF